MEVVRQALVEARLVGLRQVDLRLRRQIRRIDVGRVRIGEIRLLRAARARVVAAGTELGHQRVDRALVARITDGRISGELLAASRRLHRRRHQRHAGEGGGALAEPVLDPLQHGRGARRRVRHPAVVAAADPQHQRRLARIGETDQRAGRLVGEIDIVRAREHRRLAALVVTATAAVGRNDVDPEFVLEGEDVGVLRRRSGVVLGSARGVGNLIDRDPASAGRAAGGERAKCRGERDGAQRVRGGGRMAGGGGVHGVHWRCSLTTQDRRRPPAGTPSSGCSRRW